MFFQAIGDGQYQVIVTNPEMLMKTGGGFEDLWRNDQFTSQIISIVWDEAHCISKWGDFRPEYKHAGRLQYEIPSSIPYFVTSATLPHMVLDDITEIMRLRKNTYTTKRSNDRPNIRIAVRELHYAVDSFLDLAFLVPDNPPQDWKPPKFLIFFDDISDSIAAAQFLRSRLPPRLQDKLRFAWFNAEMTPEFREEYTEHLRKGGEVFGLCCTDSFGMVGLNLYNNQTEISLSSYDRESTYKTSPLSSNGR